MYYLTAKIIYDLGSIPDWFSAIGTVSSVIVSLYFGLHRTRKPRIIFSLLKSINNNLVISASNFSSQYVRLVAVKRKNIKFAFTNQIGYQDKSKLNFIYLAPIELKGKTLSKIPISFKTCTLAKLILKDNVSNRKFKVYFVYANNDWKIASFWKYCIYKILLFNRN